MNRLSFDRVVINSARFLLSLECFFVFDKRLFTVGNRCAVVNWLLISATTHPEMNKILQKAHCDGKGCKKNVELQYCGMNCGVCRQLSGAGP